MRAVRGLSIFGLAGLALAGQAWAGSMKSCSALQAAGFAVTGTSLDGTATTYDGNICPLGSVALALPNPTTASRATVRCVPVNCGAGAKGQTLICRDSGATGQVQYRCAQFSSSTTRLAPPQ